MNKKIITGIIVVIILALIGAGVYFFYFKKPSTGTPVGSAFPGEGLPVTSTVDGGGIDTGTEGGTFVPGGSTPLPRLYELHKLPVAGTGFSEIRNKKGVVTNTVARYIERGVGHIYETQIATYVESRIVNETRSRLSEALWGNNGKSVVVRYFDDNIGAIKTRILNNIGTPVADEFLSTEELFLPDFIPFMAVAEDGADKIFYLQNSGVTSAGYVSTFKDTEVSNIFASSFTEWLPQFPNQKLVTLTTKPSSDVPGYLFFLDTKTKVLSKVLSGINGLTTLTSRDGNRVLYAEIRNGAPELMTYDIANKEMRSLSPQTLPEKCVWGTKEATVVYCAVPQSLPTADYPDQWYQGLLSFSDDIWKIDTKTGIAEKILTPSELNVSSLDIINPVLSLDDTYLLFMNKVTGTPWVFRIAPDAPSVPQEATITVSTPTPLAAPATSVTEGMQKVR